jgi:prepilin-type processing-associated H-X9-DG protein
MKTRDQLSKIKMESCGIKKKGNDEQAFTRLEMFLVTAMLGLVMLLQVTSAAHSRSVGTRVVCLSNQRQLTKAWQHDAFENEDRLVGNLDGSGVMNLSNSNRTWVLGWLDLAEGNPAGANTNLLFLTEYSPLAPYLERDHRVFKCPDDQSRSASGAPRVRSVAMNTYMGRTMPFTSGYRTFNKMTEILAPREKFVFIDEHEGSINDPVFQVSMDGFYPNNPSQHRIIDYPGSRHAGGAALSFADGRAELWIWTDPRTTPPFRPGQYLKLGVASPNNPDVSRIQNASTIRRN